jgi:hypothetical protein
VQELIQQMTYKDFTIDFANDMSIKVVNAGTAATGTYEASSELMFS